MSSFKVRLGSFGKMAGLRLGYNCVLLCLFTSLVFSAKLNVPRVLLPLFKQFQTNFTLEVHDIGCYRWTSSRPDIVQVIPLELDETHSCSLKAVVSAVTKEPIRNTVIVLAEEVESGFVLRCDVIVDVIDSLKIVTTTRELFMEEAPEMFEVRAEDNQGNRFTTLEGVEFHWSIENVAQLSSAKEVLRFISFMESPYETPQSIEKFDSVGLQGYKVLIEGVKTGTAKVSVKLPHSEYADVQHIDVLLTVLANLLLDPPDTHILAGDTVKIRLLQMQHGRLDEVPLPSAQYVLDMEDSEIAVLDRSVSMVRGVRVGQTRVLLRDTHSEGTIKLPTATVVVTEPAYLRLVLLPHNNWVILVDEPCSIYVEIYDRKNHRIHVGDAVSVTISLNEDYFRVYSMTRNGTYIDGTTSKVGTVPVTAILESVRAIGGQEVKLKPTISTQADMMIYPRLSVTPSHVLVAWDSSLPRYEIELTATGGDGSYSWRSNDLTVLSVTQSGIVRCSGLGETTVSVSMTRNAAIKATSQVEVLPPSHLEILKHIVEAPILKPIILHIALYADREDEYGNLKRVHFTHCKHIQFRVELSNENFFQNVTGHSKPIGKACSTVAVVGKVFGTSMVKVSYKIKNLSLEASAEVAAFNPLEVVHPNKKITVLAVGTSRHVVWRGGPRVWLGRSGEHVRTISSSSSSLLVEEVSCNSQSEFYVYSFLCRELGEFNVELSVKNTAENGKNIYTESISSVIVLCAKPRSIAISVERASNGSCPYRSDSSPIVALTYEPIKLLVTILDSEGRVFDNATSLYLDWILSSKSLGIVQFEGVVILEEKLENNYIIPLQHYQIVQPKNKTGTLTIDVVVTNYRLQQLSLLKISPEHPVFWITNDQGDKVKPTIKTSLTIVLVNGASVTPDRATVFNHPNNKVVLKVTQGSGFYNFYQSSKEIAEVKYKESTQTIEVFPISDGLLQLTVIDLCLSYKSPIVEIQVLKVGSLQVEMVERVQKGSTIMATVWLYDSVENSLAVVDSELLELQPHVESHIVTVSRLTDDSADGHVNFQITGVDLGNTFVTFSSGFGDREIRSPRLPIEVFPPLRLVPQDITLPVGAVFQVTPTGGPQQDFLMDYVSTDNMIAKVNPSGLIEAQKVGDVIVTGMAVGQSKTSRGRVVYSRCEINVHVIQLEGVQIHCPLTKIKVGCQMPVWASGVPDKLSPLVLGSIEPPLAFKWSTSTPDVIELQEVFHSTGVEVSETDRLSMRVLALKPGKVTVHLNITSRSGKCGEFSDQLRLEVFEELQVTSPKSLRASSLLMAPFSQLRLRTNKDSISEVKYSVIGSSEPGYNPQQTALSSEVPVVAVNRGGLVTSHGTLGTAWVVVNSVEEYELQQTLPVNIVVKPVHYIMVSVKTKLHVGTAVISALPRGLDLNLVVSYHDNTGEAFAATRTDIRSLLNRADSVKVIRGELNGTLISKLTSYGSTVLKIWDDSTPTKCQDYVKLRVDHLITPSKGEMTVGDVACYCMPLAPGAWTTTTPAVMWMDAQSGVATALRPGQTTIKYTLASMSSSVTTSTQVTVLPIHSIVFLPLEGRNLTDWGTFSVPLLLLSEKDSSCKVSNLVREDSACPSPTHYRLPPSHHFPFICEIRFNSPMAPVDIHLVLDVQPSFSIKTGLYSCRFESITSPSANTSVLMSNVTLRAISENLVSEPLVVPFLPSFFLPSQELLLSDKQTVSTLTLIGVPIVLSHVQVIPSVGSYVAIEEPSWPETNRLVYKVSMTAMPPAEHPHIYLYVYSPLTGQNVTVPVHFKARSESLAAPCLAHPTSPWLQYLGEFLPAIVSIVVLLLVVWYSSVFNWVQAPYPPGVAVTSTPISPQVYHNGSPMSPETRAYMYRQPFSDVEPVYGDPNLSHSPGLTRRDRR